MPATPVDVHMTARRSAPPPCVHTEDYSRVRLPSVPVLCVPRVWPRVPPLRIQVTMRPPRRHSQGGG